MQNLNIDPGKRTGCLQCELACSYEHTGTFNPSRSYIKVFTFHHEGRFAPYTCTSVTKPGVCELARLMPFPLMPRRQVISDDKCVGCGSAPSPAIWYRELLPGTGKVVMTSVAVTRSVLRPPDRCYHLC